MNKILTMALLIGLLVGLLSLSNVYATGFGMNITIPDRMYSSSKPWWGAQEDNEVEPNCDQGHIWDLEAFFMEGLNLTMVGTFDYRYGHNGYLAGDIFVEVDGEVTYGPPNDGTGAGDAIRENKSGYDFVYHIDYSNLNSDNTFNFDLYSIDKYSKVKTVHFSQNQESNPWIYYSGGNKIASGTASYLTGLKDSDVGLSGNASHLHNAVTVNLALISSHFNAGKVITFHNTYQCGNDNLMGAIPEPASLLLLGSGLVGFGIIVRIRRKRS